MLYWLLPREWPLVGLLRPAPRTLDLLFLAGLSTVLGGVWVLVFNLPLVTRPLIRATGGVRTLSLALRTASSNPLQHRFRTGLIVAMFALVIFNMVIAGVLLTATHRAYNDPEALAGGFDVRAELTPPNAPLDLRAELANASAVRPDDFTTVGRLLTRPGQVIELAEGMQRWRSYSLQEIDEGFVAGLRAPLAARAAGYASDAEVWAAVLSESGVAVAAGTAVGPRQPDGPAQGLFRFADLFQGDTRFKPTPVWARDERGGSAVELTVIGVLDPRVSFGPGLYTGQPSIALAGAPAPQRVVSLLKTRPDGDPTSLAIGLNASFGDRGVRASALGEEVRRIHSVRGLLNEILQGFFGVGLIAGLAALGLMSMRAVLERQQQIGMLRALGFRRSAVRLSLFFEISLLALLGTWLGIALGLAFSRQIVDQLSRQFPEIVFAIPWDQIGLITAGAYLAALAMAAVSLWQIGRIPPAAAIRVN
jgi:putative ABC transport system permease protein